MTLAELSKKYGVHPTQIGTWKRAAIENMATAFTRKGSAPEPVNAADVDKLHSVNWQGIAQQCPERERSGSWWWNGIF